MFALHFDTTNAAFEGDAGPEVARILQVIAAVVTVQDSGVVRDVNGNAVGRWELT